MTRLAFFAKDKIMLDQPKLPEAVKTLCQLVMANARVRNACIRNNTIEVLVEHISHKYAITALLTILSTSRGKREVAQFKQAIGNAFCNTDVDPMITMSIFRLMTMLNVPFDCVNVVKRILTLTLCHDAWDIASTIPFLRKIPSTLIEDGLNGVDPIAPEVDIAQVRLMTYLARRSLPLTRLIATKYGSVIISNFIERKQEEFLPLLYSIAPYLPAKSFRLDILNIGVIPDMHLLLFRVIFHYVQTPVKGHKIMRDILQSPEWSVLQTALYERLRELMDTDSCYRIVVPTLLLTAFITNVRALEAKTVDVLSEYLLLYPRLFNFECDENPTILNQIVLIGQKLAMPNYVLSSYKDRLDFALWVKRIYEELALYGVPDWKPPDAFCCPVTLELMREPVIASDGHTYEHKTLKQLLDTTRCSPLTRERLQPNVIVPNINLKKRIRDLPEEVCHIIRRAKCDDVKS